MKNEVELKNIVNAHIKDGVAVTKLMYWVKTHKYGQFMYLETITLVPIDLDGINPEHMSFEEKKWLNTYHAMVYEKIAPHLTEDEREWLREYTREI